MTRLSSIPPVCGAEGRLKKHSIPLVFERHRMYGGCIEKKRTSKWDFHIHIVVFKQPQFSVNLDLP